MLMNNNIMMISSCQVYVLLISNVTVWDEGLYTCEVNFNPVLRSFHQLKVLSASDSGLNQVKIKH